MTHYLPLRSRMLSTANAIVDAKARAQPIRKDTHASPHRLHVDNRIQHLRPHSRSRCRPADDYQRCVRVPHARVSNGRVGRVRLLRRAVGVHGQAAI